MLQINEQIYIKDNSTLNRSESYYQLTTYNSILIESDVENMTTTCRINIPIKKFKVYDNGLNYTYKKTDGLLETVYMKVNDGIIINLQTIPSTSQVVGALPFTTYFVGFIVKFEKIDETSFDIYCEDFMYALKQMYYNFSYDKPTLKAVFFDMFNKLNYKMLLSSDILYNFDNTSQLGDIRCLTKINACTLLENIKKELEILYFYFRLEYKAKVPKSDTGRSQNDTSYNGFTHMPFLHVGFKNVNYDGELPDRLLIYKFTDYYDELYEETKKVKEKFNYGGILEGSTIKYSTVNKNTDLVVNGIYYDTAKKQIDIYTVDGKNIITKTKDNTAQFEEGKKGRNTEINFNLKDSSKELVEKCILEAWNNFQNGFTGSEINVLGYPMIRTSDYVYLKLKESFDYLVNDNKTYIYAIDKVVTKINEQDGFIQTLTLGKQLPYNIK